MTISSSTKNKGNAKKAIAALNVYKKVAIVRRSTDTVTYEDEKGNLKVVSDLVGEVVAASSSAKPKVLNKPKNDIPVPRIRVVKEYDEDVSSTYELPKHYVRFHRISDPQWDSSLQYGADADDEKWLKNKYCNYDKNNNNNSASATQNYQDNKNDKSSKSNNNDSYSKQTKLQNKRGSSSGAYTATKQQQIKPSSSKSSTKTKTKMNTSGGGVRKNNTYYQSSSSPSEYSSFYHQQLYQQQQKKFFSQVTVGVFEKIMDLLEKATGFDAILSDTQAETLIISNIPNLYQSFNTTKREYNNRSNMTIFSDSINFTPTQTSNIGSANRYSNNTIGGINIASASTNFTVGSNSNGLKILADSRGVRAGSFNASSMAGRMESGGGNNKSILALSSSATSNKQNNSKTSSNVSDKNNKKINMINNAINKKVCNDVYNYWVSKRCKLKRPLLRKFWPITSCDDTNPHLVFRPREKEKYKLRNKKSRQNNLETFKKLKQLRNDFNLLKIVCKLCIKREELLKLLMVMQYDLFQQRIHNVLDTSTHHRVSKHISKDSIASELHIKSYFDITSSAKSSGANGYGGNAKKNRKGRRSNTSAAATGNNNGSSLSVGSMVIPGVATGSGGILQHSDSSSTYLATAMINGATSINYNNIQAYHSNNVMHTNINNNASIVTAGTTVGNKMLTRAGGRSSSSSSSLPTAHMTPISPTPFTPFIIAGSNNGGSDPVPNFLQVLPSRDTYVTSWENSVPHVTSYIGGNALPTSKFRHRKRVGRGGRLIIDRLPCPSSMNENNISASRNTYTASKHCIAKNAFPLKRWDTKGKRSLQDQQDAIKQKRQQQQQQLKDVNKIKQQGYQQIFSSLSPPPLKEPAETQQKQQKLAIPAKSIDTTIVKPDNQSSLSSLTMPATQKNDNMAIHNRSEVEGNIDDQQRYDGEVLLDLLPQPLNHDLISQRIEELCIHALKEDFEKGTNNGGRNSPTNAGGIGAGGNSVLINTPSAMDAAPSFVGSSAATSTIASAVDEENNCEEVIVKIDDWIDTDDLLWGKERYSIGPL